MPPCATLTSGLLSTSVCPSNPLMNNELSNILGVSPSASTDEIHAAYRRKARQHHPDLGGDRQKFQQISDAYEQLLKQKNSEKFTLATQTSNSPPATPKPNPYRSPQEPRRKRKKSGKRDSERSGEQFERSARHLLTGKLPLQNQTTWFILVNALDIYLTYLHLVNGNYEANPIAAFFIRQWDILGMVAYKMTIVATVCVIAQIVALKSLQKATRLLSFGTAFIACVVVYSVWLLIR